MTWGELADALALAPSEEALVTAGRNGDVRGRITHHYRPPQPLPPEYWNGTLDLDRSRIRPCAHQDFDGRVTVYGWVRVQVDLQSVRECFGLDPQPEPGRPVGRSRAIPARVMIAAAFWVYEHGIPKLQKDLEDKIRDLLAERGLSASESTVRSLAVDLIAEHQRPQGKVEN